jgi:hypothetical protein
VINIALLINCKLIEQRVNDVAKKNKEFASSDRRKQQNDFLVIHLVTALLAVMKTIRWALINVCILKNLQ